LKDYLNYFNQMLITWLHEGSTTTFRFNGSYWEVMQKLTNLNREAGDGFGSSVSISRNYVIVGAYFTHLISPNVVEQGAASIYQRVGLGWQRLQYIIDPGGNKFDWFGISAAIDGTIKRFLIGASGYTNSSGK
jgi:hypothetical protein